jgi:hypothetical protein
VDCAACHHVALLTPEALLKLGLSPQIKGLDLPGASRPADAEREVGRSFRSGGGRQNG